MTLDISFPKSLETLPLFLRESSLPQWWTPGPITVYKVYISIITIYCPFCVKVTQLRLARDWAAGTWVADWSPQNTEYYPEFF